MKRRYSELDAIRGVAVIMVLLYHYTIRYGDIYEHSIEPLFHFEFGHYGVQLFFMVSGFVIFLTLNKTNYAIDFIISRFSRLYPAYWFAVLLTFLAVTLFSLKGRENSLGEAIINLTMLQKWLGVSDVDGVYWTLIVELTFYLIMLLLFINKQLKNIEYIAIIWLTIIIIAPITEFMFSITIHWTIKLLFLLKYGNLFIAGIMFYKIMHQAKNIHYIILAIALVSEFHLYGTTLGLFVSAYFLMFLLFVKGYLALLAQRPLIFLGTISYSLYLIHQNIGYIIIQKLELYNLATPISVIVTPLAVTLLIATLMQHYVEKPTLKLIRDRWKSSNLRQQITMPKLCWI